MGTSDGGVDCSINRRAGAEGRKRRLAIRIVVSLSAVGMLVVLAGLMLA